MEHDIIQAWARDRGITIHEEMQNKLLAYADLLHETNKKFNLTGITALSGIIKDLIIGSIDPVIRLDVPRGTLFADIGSGAGIPGVPVGIFHSHLQGVLIDANNKKASFIGSVIRSLKLDNLKSYHGRVENIVRERTVGRESYDIVFSRAFGDLFYVLEMGAPLVKKNGMLYVYSSLLEEDIPAHILEHSRILGLTVASTVGKTCRGISDSGLLFVKTGATDSRYPRKIALIKRDMAMHPRRGNG